MRQRAFYNKRVPVIKTGDKEYKNPYDKKERERRKVGKKFFARRKAYVANGQGQPKGCNKNGDIAYKQRTRFSFACHSHTVRYYTINTVKEKRVLLVITKSNFGGAQRCVYELATRLREDGNKGGNGSANGQKFETAVALGGNGLLKTKLQEAGVPIFPISSAQRDISITKEVKVLWRLYRIMRKYKPDIVHLHSPKVGGLGSVAARVASFFNHYFAMGENRRPISKIIYTNHGWPFKEPRPEKQLVLIRIFSWLTVFLSGKTIVLSQTEKNDVRNWPIIGSKLVVIPNGLTPFNLAGKEEALRALVGDKKADILLNEKWLVVGTISELHKNKGLPYAIEGVEEYIKHTSEDAGGKASSHRAKTVFIIIGGGEERASLENLIQEKNLKSHIFLAGPVDEAREYLKAFDVFLMASVKEGLPFAILEAGYAEVPVISTSVGAIPEVIQNLETGLLIHPARPLQIKNALIYLDEHPEIRKQLTTALKKRVSETFNFDTVVKKIKDLYLNLN